jgi:hypothetical protein
MPSRLRFPREPWTAWQGSSAWALERLREAEPRILDVAPRERWDAAFDRLMEDYNLAEEERYRFPAREWSGRR